MNTNGMRPLFNIFVVFILVATIKVLSKMVKNLVYHARTKHIEVHHHYIIKLINNEDICLYYCPTIGKTSNIMTKPLSNKFVKFIYNIGIASGGS